MVHGGELFAESTVITDEVFKGIEECIDLAPLHNPNNIKCILASRQVFGVTCPRWRFLTPPSISPFQSMRTFTPCLITFIDATTSAVSDFMAPHIDLCLSDTGPCVD